MADGHDVIAASVLYKHEKEKKWQEVRMQPHHNNHWQASFAVKKQGYYAYKVVGWVDYALNWQHGIERKIADNQHVNSELLEGISFVNKCEPIATASKKKYLNK